MADDAGILDTIGDTPLVRLRRIVPASGAEIWVKLEYRNPTGSMKDRMGLSMIEGAERDGLLEPGMTIVEYTGGSTGPALALVCRAKGYRARIVISECFSEERMQLMRALGAELELIPAVEERGRVTAQDIRNMVERAAELAREPGTYATDQFNNPYVIPGHRDMLGREIWEQTGGARGGVLPRHRHGRLADGRLGRAEGRNPDVRIVGARAGRLRGDQRRPERIVRDAGLDGHRSAALGRRPRRRRLDDRGRRGRRDDAPARARGEGSSPGISTGANIVGSLRLAEELPAGSVVVTLAVDSGFKYMGGPP